MIEKTVVIEKKRELVKPRSMETTQSEAVESLCDGFACGVFDGSPAGDDGIDQDILF